MDFIFEEDMDEVGSDIEAYCPKCKADTAHTVITKYEDEVRRVQCSPCGDVHAYRKPRGEVEEDVPEPVAAKKRALAKKPTWQEAADKAGNKAINQARPYTIRDHYHEGDIVSHPKFGVGFVTEISENKAEVTFQDERRVLVHNRPDLAAQMPAIAPVPAPREEKPKGKRAAGKNGKDHHKNGKKAAVAEAPAPVAAPTSTQKGKTAAPAAPAAKPAAPVTAAKKPEPAKAPEKKAKPEPAKKAPVQGKAARAQAAVKKKEAAKGGPKKAAPAKPAPRPAKPTAAARSMRASRAAHASKSKLKKKAR